MTSLALACKLNAARTPTSLAARAVAAIRRNGGTLLLPGAATPVLGGELVTNGDFSNGTTAGWTTSGAALSVVDGQMQIQTSGAAVGFAYQSFATVAGKTYLLTMDTNVISGTGLFTVGVGAGSTSIYFGASFTGAGPKSITFTATSATTFVSLFQYTATAGLQARFDNISVKEILSYTNGNPALRNYLDSAGTDILDSVTQVDQPVGLCLDSMVVLGAELFTGSYFVGAATTATYVGNEATATFGGSLTSTANNWLSLPGAATANGYSEIEFWATYVSGGNLEVGRIWTVAQTITAASNAGVRTRYKVQAFAATAAGLGRAAFGSTTAGSVWKIELISVREIPGNHATQPTTASKPLLRRGLVNQLLHSHNQADISWVKTQCTITSGVADPAGGTGARKIVEPTGPITNSFVTSFAAKPAASVPYTAASLVSASGRNFAFVQVSDGAGNGVRVFFSLVDGSITSPAATIGTGFSVPSASAVQVSHGWWLLAVSGTTNAAAVAYNHTGLSNNGTTLAYTGDGASGIATFGFGVFQGTVTAQQIIAAGGIPLTTTAPASSERGRYSWRFDGSNDFLQTGITTGNEGWVCAGVTCNVSGVGHHIFGNGASVAADVGVWFRANGANDAVTLLVSNGTTREIASRTTAAITGQPKVVDGGWTASTMFAAIDGAETSIAKTVNCTTTKVCPVGGGPAMGWYLNGPMSATVYCPVLPSAADRALIRRFVGSLQGQAL